MTLLPTDESISPPSMLIESSSRMSGENNLQLLQYPPGPVTTGKVVRSLTEGDSLGQ